MHTHDDVVDIGYHPPPQQEEEDRSRGRGAEAGRVCSRKPRPVPVLFVQYLQRSLKSLRRLDTAHMFIKYIGTYNLQAVPPAASNKFPIFLDPPCVGRKKTRGKGRGSFF